MKFLQRGSKLHVMLWVGNPTFKWRFRSVSIRFRRSLLFRISAVLLLEDGFGSQQDCCMRGFCDYLYEQEKLEGIAAKETKKESYLSTISTRESIVCKASSWAPGLQARDLFLLVRLLSFVPFLVLLFPDGGVQMQGIGSVDNQKNSIRGQLFLQYTLQALDLKPKATLNAYHFLTTANTNNIRYIFVSL